MVRSDDVLTAAEGHTFAHRYVGLAHPPAKGAALVSSVMYFCASHSYSRSYLQFICPVRVHTHTHTHKHDLHPARCDVSCVTGDLRWNGKTRS